MTFVIPTKSNKRIKEIYKKHTKENLNIFNAFEYKFKDEGPTFDIVAIFDQDKEYIYLQQIKKWIILDKLGKQISYEYRNDGIYKLDIEQKRFKIRTFSNHPLQGRYFL